MNALVIGFGSIGARHARILNELGCHTAVVSQRNIDFPLVYPGLTVALNAESPEVVVVANETSLHFQTINSLAGLGYEKSLLVEKPLFSQKHEIVSNSFRHFGVAYNLRFHPVIQRLKSLLLDEKILSVQAYAGQYLPDWRSSRDYRSSYSASKRLGGGALRDISHELDYLVWILGGWNKVVAVGGHYSNLEIDSDDVFSLMLDTPACPVVSLQINYLDRVGRRFILINTLSRTIEADLVKGTITIDNKIDYFTVKKDSTYLEMHKAMLAGDQNTVCSLNEGVDIMNLIEATELASSSFKWIAR